MPHTPSPYLVTNTSGARPGAAAAPVWPALEARAALAMFRVTEDATHLHASLAAAHQLGREALLAGADDQGCQGLAAPDALISSEPLLLAHWSEGAVQALTEQLVRAGGDHREVRRRAVAALAKLYPTPRTTGTVTGDAALADWWPRTAFERGQCLPGRWRDGSDLVYYYDHLISRERRRRGSGIAGRVRR